MSRPSPYPALHATHAGAWIADTGGVREVSRAEAVAAAIETPHILLNAPLVAARLNHPPLSGLDLLELFAFVHPATFAIPSPAGFAAALNLPPPTDAHAAAFLLQAAETLLATTRAPWHAEAGAHDTAQALSRLSWPWAQPLLAGLPKPAKRARALFQSLPKWEETPPRDPPRTIRLPDAQVDAELDRLRGARREPREGQRAFARAVAHALRPRESDAGPNLVIAQAGTGIGKTLGYLAPAAAYARESGGAVWLSTYTRALQRQLDSETRAIYPDDLERARRVVVRKGRENYLCLLNLEDAVQGAFLGRAGQFAHLVARWARFTRDGDMVGGDLPGWLPGLFDRRGLPAFTDRRGECVFGSCPHWRPCFVERAARASLNADLVIANHALVMANAVRQRGAASAAAESRATARIIFDEGHHLAEAADGAFAMALNGAETVELRRWIAGPERSTRGRRRGLAARLSDVQSYDHEGALLLDQVAAAADILPADGWLSRLADGTPEGPLELFLTRVREAVLARAPRADAGFSLETDLAEPPADLIDSAAGLADALAGLAGSLARLAHRLSELLDEAPDWIDGAGLTRLDATAQALDARGRRVASWLAICLRICAAGGAAGGSPANPSDVPSGAAGGAAGGSPANPSDVPGGEPDPDFVDWLEVVRIDGRELDAGVRRHWLDPTKPLAEAVLAPAHGVAVTSATLAEDPCGARHLSVIPRRFAAESPFDYASAARAFVVTDVPTKNVAALAAAFSRLITAAGGGTLGLFTAIARLRAVHARLADDLARRGLPLFAQHVDPIDPGTLVDLFRADPHASLLGTDALRDGVDVPGDTLRLVVLEGLPWSRPTVLQAARRAAGASEDDAVRARLAQAFGRLIRRETDRGVFVILGSAVPSRLLAALPVPAERVGLDDAAARIAHFLQAGAPPFPALGGPAEGA